MLYYTIFKCSVQAQAITSFPLPAYNPVMDSNIQSLDVKEPILIARSLELTFTKILLGGYTYQNYLLNGRNIPHLKIRPRELLGLCVLSYLGKHLTNETWLPATDPWGKDGAIVTDRGGLTGLIIEQTYVSAYSKGDLTTEVIKAIRKKENRGKPYAEGINLVIFVDRDGELSLRNVAPLVQKSYFGAIYLFGLADPKKFEYYVGIIKSPSEPLGGYRVSVDHRSGKATVKRDNIKANS
jgi:hypothetical protein